VSRNLYPQERPKVGIVRLLLFKNTFGENLFGAVLYVWVKFVRSVYKQVANLVHTKRFVLSLNKPLEEFRINLQQFLEVRKDIIDELYASMFGYNGSLQEGIDEHPDSALQVTHKLFFGFNELKY
jgi:hypothetical protein